MNKKTVLSLSTFWNASLVQIPLPIPYIVKFSTSVSSTSKFKFRPSGDANVSIWLPAVWINLPLPPTTHDDDDYTKPHPATQLVGFTCYLFPVFFFK